MDCKFSWISSGLGERGWLDGLGIYYEKMLVGNRMLEVEPVGFAIGLDVLDSLFLSGISLVKWV